MKTNSIAFAIGLCISAGIILYSCTKNDSGSAAANNTSTGQGGSLARFTIAGDYLYGVESHTLYAFSLVNPAVPQKVYTSPTNYDIETIYAYGSNLFLGTKTGLYIYSIDTPAHPRLTGEAKHARSCDPVVVSGTTAFVTLKSTPACGPAISGLYIHDVSNLKSPVLIKTVELPNPVGLGLKDSILYVCCGSAGLKVFNVKNPSSPGLISTQNDGNFVDVIPYNNILICYVDDGIILYDITKPALPVFIKKIVD